MKDIVNHPWFGISSWIIGLLGFIFAIYTYYATKQYGYIFYISSDRQIYSAINSDFNNTDILLPKYRNAKDIYVSQITVWNAGTQTIEEKDFRSPLLISGDKRFEIFDYKIINEKTALDKNLIVRNKEDRQLEITWKILDPVDAFKVQIIHSGSPYAVTVSGKFSPNNQVSRMRGNGFILISGFLLSGFVFMVLIGNRYKIFDAIDEQKYKMFFSVVNISSFIISILISMSVMVGIVYFSFIYGGYISPISYVFEGQGGLYSKPD